MVSGGEISKAQNFIATGSLAIPAKNETLVAQVAPPPAPESFGSPRSCPGTPAQVHQYEPDRNGDIPCFNNITGVAFRVHRDGTPVVPTATQPARAPADGDGAVINRPDDPASSSSRPDFNVISLSFGGGHGGTSSATAVPKEDSDGNDLGASNGVGSDFWDEPASTQSALKNLGTARRYANEKEEEGEEGDHVGGNGETAPYTQFKPRFSMAVDYMHGFVLAERFSFLLGGGIGGSRLVGQSSDPNTTGQSGNLWIWDFHANVGGRIHLTKDPKARPDFSLDVILQPGLNYLNTSLTGKSHGLQNGPDVSNNGYYDVSGLRNAYLSLLAGPNVRIADNFALGLTLAVGHRWSPTSWNTDDVTVDDVSYTVEHTGITSEWYWQGMAGPRFEF